MSQPTGFADKIGVIWGVADLLRGDFKAHEYGQVILPLVVLRRLECALAPTKAAVVAAAEKAGNSPGADAILRRTAGGHRFYNTSKLDLTAILNDAGAAAANLRTYIASFSPSAREVLDAYRFDEKIAALDKAGLLYQVIAKFADLDLTEASVPNDTMGYIFEELLRRFSEMSNETAGEHFTPREVVRLMVNILFVEDDAALSGAKPVRTLYDGACGTGGMLSVAQEHLKQLNPSAVLEVYGQELNPETWAVCRSDLMIKGQDPTRIVLGNSLTDEDGHPDLRTDYQIQNPPFGVAWNKYADKVTAEHEQGDRGRYAVGLPRVSDGSLLFLQNMISKFKPVVRNPAAPDLIQGGSRLAVVFSGSPLFAGAAGGGESEIRRWILENDWLEAVVALPDQLFYNTTIHTYFWVLTNRKPADRQGKVVLLDARASFARMGKSLGDKRKFIPDEAVADITRLYHEALDLEAQDKRIKVFSREAFGYQRIAINQPMRRVWQLTPEALDDVTHDKAWLNWSVPPKGCQNPIDYVHDVETAQAAVGDLLQQMTSSDAVASEREFADLLSAALAGSSLRLPDKIFKVVVKAAAVYDEAAPEVTDKRGRALADPDLRTGEHVPLPEGWLDLDDAERTKALVASAEEHLQREIHSFAPTAWIDHSKTKVGFEIPFTRYFYEYTAPRPLAEIDADLEQTEQRVHQLLKDIVR